MASPDRLLMHFLLASAAILAGTSSSHNMGETGAAPMLVAEARLGAFGGEVQFVASHKVETGDGWAARGSLDYWEGPLSVGLGYTRRETRAWHKDVLWARASVEHGKLRLVAQVAPTSDRMEAQVEARLTLAHKWLRLEPRAWVGTHTVAEELGGYAYGLSMLAGWGR